MLTRNRALFGLLAASLAANAGCDFDGSNTPPAEPDLMLDGSGADAPSAPGTDATPGNPHDAASEAGVADATVDAEAGLDAALPLDAPSGADVLPVFDTGADVAMQTGIEAGVDATVDAGIDAGIDAGPVVGVDAADSGPINTGSSPVAVTITGPTGPESGVPIVFHDPSGIQLGVVTTDATGTASMVVQAGSMVTAIFGTPDQSTLISMAAVEPGDVISLVDPTQRGSFSASPSIHLPDSAPPEGTNKYQFIVADGCSTETTSDTSSASVDIESTCVGPNALFPALVLAEDSNGSPLAFDFKDDNPAGVDGGATPDVSLSEGFISSLGTEAIETSTAPEPDGLIPSFASVRQIADGVSYTEQQGVDANDDGSSDTILTLEPGFASAMQTEVDLLGVGSLVAVASHEPAPAHSGTDEFDLSQLPPEITSTQIDASNVATPTITWQSTSPLQYATAGIVVSASWNGTDGESPQNGTWFLVAPSTATSVSPPALSDSVAAYSPAGDADWVEPVGIIAFGGTIVTVINYDDFRGFIGGVLPSFANAAGGTIPVVPILPADRTLTVSIFPFDY